MYYWRHKAIISFTKTKIMKQFLILLLSCGFLLSCNNDKKDPNRRPTERDDYRSKDEKDKDPDNKKTDYNDNDGWSKADIRLMNEKCLESLDNDEEKARLFCPCMLEKVQRKFSSYNDLDSRGTEAEGRRMGEECKTAITGDDTKEDNNNYSGGAWPSTYVNQFVNSCVSQAVGGGMSSSIAKSYCSCMQQKLEKLYPDPADAGSVDMDSPSMKRMIKDCLDF